MSTLEAHCIEARLAMVIAIVARLAVGMIVDTMTGGHSGASIHAVLECVLIIHV
ncbi:hypothetical protein BDV36DRAFT_242482 [Aspergillus pseudocaelatus]|uniref:Uncharacterized protein n=1 Tax=Aspergillus pseudocaelatus TaxID=1825620 RepID=A0ABQ6X3V3_9EURO|nr:hypothetical protein BDV36DRAFT_242482 [Aspergillus pseudocaelatus]